MWKDSDRKRSTQRRWEKHRQPRNRRGYFATWKARQDPNRRREREQEQRFRWRRRAGPLIGPRGWPLATITRLEHSRPTFVLVDKDGVLQQERWETPDELVARLEKKGALMITKKHEKPREIDVSMAREILAATIGKHAEEADRRENEIHIRVQQLLIKSSHRPEADAIARKALEAWWEHTRAIAELRSLCEADFDREGYVHVLEEK